MDGATVTPELLGFFPLLAFLPHEELAQLAQTASLIAINRRGIVYEAGSPTRAVYFLFEGRLQGTDFTIDGREVGLFFTEPKDYCGELGLFDGGDHSETLIATVKSRVVTLPSAALREVLFKHPAALDDACQRVAKRVRTLTEQRSLLAIPDIPQRICAQLVTLAQPSDKDKPTANITNPPTHQELAIMLNTSRETVTRVFQRLQTQGICHKEGTYLLDILLPEQLRAIAEGEEKL